MSQQLKNGSRYDGSVTITVRDTDRYAVVNYPGEGKWRKPQDPSSLQHRHNHWVKRRAEAGIGKGVYS